MNRIDPVKRLVTFLCFSALILLATACTAASLRPSEADGQAALALQVSLESPHNSENVKVVAFKKIDGQDRRNGLGVQLYAMTYESTYECIAPAGCLVCPGRPNANKMVAKGYYKAANDAKLYDCQNVDKGVKNKTQGQILFEKSEKGWTAR